MGPPIKFEQYLGALLYGKMSEKQLENLIELQKIDWQILVKQRIIEEIPTKITEEELPLKDLEKSIAKMKQKRDSLEKKKRAKEREIDDINEKIKKMKTRITEIKTNKEYQAHLKEIESAEKERYSVEDDILVLMEEIDAISKETLLEERKLQHKNQELEAFKRQLEGEVADAEKRLMFLKEARSRIVSTIDNDVYTEYMQLIESSDAIAVIEAKEEVCQGCYMNIPPQLFVEIKKNDKIINCPQCRRILYYKSTN